MEEAVIPADELFTGEEPQDTKADAPRGTATVSRSTDEIGRAHV